MIMTPAYFRLLTGLFVLLLLPLSNAKAHPSVSVVTDQEGNIYYSDLQHVWIIRPDGSKSIAVRSVHTHELWLSPEGILYGEDVTNRGDDYRHRIWALHPDGSVKEVLPWRKDHPTMFNDYAFVRDAEGNEYAAHRGDKTIGVLRNTKQVSAINLQDYPGPMHWHHYYQGKIYAAVGDRLIRADVQNGASVVMAEGLTEFTKDFAFTGERHALMGIWNDPEGGIYVSVFGGQKVKKVSQEGTVTDVFTCPDEWSVTGGTFDAKGNMLLLEWSASNQVRIRKIFTDGNEEVF